MSKKIPSWLISVVAPLIVFIGILNGMKAWYNWHPDFLQPSREALFRHTSSGWQSLPSLHGRPEAVRVSANFTVWVMAFTYDAGETFAKLDGSRWQIYRLKDIDPKGFHTIANDDFVLDGEDLWAAGGKEIFHFDGQRWQVFHDQSAEAIAAGGGEAWALDDKRRLAHFARGQWTPVNAQPPEEESENDPQLVRTTDGSLWLASNRLWRLDGTTWREISTGFEHVNLIGAADDRIWLWEGRNLKAISSDGETQTVYSPEQTTLGRRERVYDAESRGGGTWFSTWSSLLRFDGTDWRRVNLPGNGVKSLTRIVAGVDEDLWAIGSIPNPWWRYTRFAQPAVSVFVILSLLGIPIWMVRRYKRERLDEAQRVRQAVEHATGVASDHLERTERRLTRESSWLGASISVVLPVVALIGYQVLRIFWRSAPSWSFLAMAVALHFGHMLWQSVTKKTPKPWDPIEPGGPGYDWSETRRVLPGTIVVFLLLNFDKLWRYMGDPARWIQAAVLIWFGYQVLRSKFIIGALKRGEYDEAGKAVVRFHPHNPDGPHALRMRALSLLLGGRYGEAEELARRAVARTRNGVEQAYALDCLGDALLEQGRYEEAMRAYEAAIQARPGFRRAYRGMAEVLLRQGTNPPRALEVVEQVAGPSGPSRNKWGLNSEVRDDYWALKAWALAQLGRTAEVTSAIENALRFTDKKSKPSMGTTLYRAGMAMDAMGEDKQAAEYLRRAQEIDPEGRAGKVAAQAAAARKSRRIAHQLG